MDTTSEVNAGSDGRKERPARRRGATKDNTEFTGLFTRVPQRVRFLVASFYPDLAFLARPS